MVDPDRQGGGGGTVFFLLALMASLPSAFFLPKIGGVVGPAAPPLDVPLKTVNELIFA